MNNVNDVNVCNGRHASWSKLMGALLLCTTNNSLYDYVVCIDSDCIFQNIRKPLKDLIDKYPEHDLIIANNGPYHAHLPCCAFFICKNTNWTRDFLKKWYNNPLPARDSEIWKRVLDVANKTYATPVFDCGHFWEQDSMWVLFQDPEIAKHIQLYDEPIMYSEVKDQFLLHISHERHEIRKTYFLEYVIHLEKQTKQSFETILSIIPVIMYDTVDIHTNYF